jgi:hypothetical protein
MKAILEQKKDFEGLVIHIIEGKPKMKTNDSIEKQKSDSCT